MRGINEFTVKNCGKKLPDGVQFCTGCGTKVDHVPNAAKTTTVVTGSTSNTKNSKTPFLIGAVVIVILLAVFVFRSGDSKSETALADTTEEETIAPTPEEILLGAWGSNEDSDVGLKFREDGTVAVSGLGLDIGSEKVTYTADENTITLSVGVYNVSTDFTLAYKLSEDQNKLTISIHGVSMDLYRK